MAVLEDVIQQSAEWLTMRTGCVTASRVRDVVGKYADGKRYLAGRKNYMLEVVCERLTGLHIDHYVTPAMQYGTDTEPIAREAYEVATGEFVSQVGLAIHPSIELFVASPDGLVGKDGAMEIKCPQPLTHLEWVQNGEIPAEHLPQLKAVMSCAERKWIDFVSYCPKMPKNLQILIRRLEWDREMIEAQDAEVVKFLAEAAELEKSLKSLKL
jgi:putative phage-type endonuclease